MRYFDHDCDVYIHIDKKQPIATEEEERLRAYGQVRLVSRQYDVNWGGTSVLESEMYLLRMAVSQSEADYFHLISGQDYPTRPLEYFLKFFEKNAGKEFIGYLHLPHPNWENNTFRRLQYFYPYDYAAGQSNPRRWVREQVKAQQAKGEKRPIPDEFDHLYGSSQWFSITRKAVVTLLDYTDQQPRLYGRMWMTFAPEECYVATVLVNLMGKENIVPWNHRFIRWKYENGNRPANLGSEHMRYLLEDECLMARKIELPCSAALLDKIDRYLHQDGQIMSMPTGGWVYNGLMKHRYDKKFADYVMRMWCDVSARTGLDMGCGAGCYVAQWRSRGLSFAGYDANPYTEAEYEAMLENDTWPGGYVEGLGYCGKAVIVTASYPDSDSMGSDDSWPSEDSFENPWESDDNENDTDNPSTGGNQGGQSGNTGEADYVGGGNSGGGSGGSNYPRLIFNGQNFTFLYNEPFYTEREMETMKANGTWNGGNVFTLGYVGTDYVINANIPSLDIDYDILDVYSEYYRDFSATTRSLIENAMDQAKSKIENGTITIQP